MTPQRKKFEHVSLYQVKGVWRVTTCKIEKRRITRRLGKQQALAERYAAQVSEWIAQYRARLITVAKLLQLLGESVPVADLLVRYQQSLSSRGRSANYIRTMMPRLKILLELADVDRAAQLSVAGVNRALDALRSGSEERAPVSDQTLAHYLRAVRQFARFLTREPNRLFDTDPLQGLVSRPVSRVMRQRRSPTAQEIQLLLQHVERLPAGPFALTGFERGMLYAFALATGLRLGELRQLRVSWIDLDRGVVAVPGVHTKNGQPAYQPLPQWLIDRCRSWLAPRSGDALVWPSLPKVVTIALRADQAGARQAWIDAVTGEPRAEREASDVLRYRSASGVFDFHALRHAYVTRVVGSGASVKEAQALARHSDPKLTIGLYSHADAARMRIMVDAAIPDPARAQAQSAAQ